MTTDPNGVNWIKISDATASGKYIFKTAEKIRPEGIKRSRLVNEGDFLLSNSMSFGRPYIMKTTGCIHDGWLVISNKNDTFDKDFLYYFLSSTNAYSQFDRLAAGSTVRNLNIDSVRKVTAPVPPLPEQRRIVAVLDEAFKGLAIATANTEKSLKNARELFESHLNSFFENPSVESTTLALSSFVSITHGYAFDGADFEVDDDENKLIVLTPGNYSEHGELEFIAGKTKRFAGNVVPNGYLFDRGDLTVVMTDLSSKMKILGKPAFVDRSNVLHNQRIGRLLFKNGLLQSRMLYYFMRSKGYLESIRGSATGTMVRHTAPSRILNCKMSFPRTFSSQVDAISRFDALEAEVKRLEALFTEKLAAIAELKQSLLQKAFAGELTKDFRPEEVLS